MDKAIEVITNIRNIRQQKQISPRETLKAYAKVADIDDYQPTSNLVWKLANVSDFEVVSEKVENTVSFHIGADEWFIAIDQEIDHEKEIAAIEEEIKYLIGFLVSVNKKLGNERFVQSAPANVVEMERKKKDDVEARISALNEKLTSLKEMMS
jgi:valyl-tRNA synthetase